MELIVSHQHLDFDGLASMIAARLLYPGAVLSLPGAVNPEVEDFISLYKDHLTLIPAAEIDLDEIETLIVVDCRPDERIGPFQQLRVREDPPRIIVYDHHREEEQTADDYQLHYAQVGATVTLLVEALQERDYPLSTFQATLLALGIHADTGSLRYPSTTPRDSSALTYLLQKEVNLEVVDDFLVRPLNPQQQEVLNRLLDGSERLQFEGIYLQLFETSCSQFVPGINRLVYELKKLTDAEIVITIITFERGISLIGRCKGEVLDLSTIFGHFDGGGHPGAAAAFIKGGSAGEIKKRLLELIREEIEPGSTAESIMSAPVRVIGPEESMEDAGELMDKYGHSGLVVVNEGGELVGIISRRDLNKGRRHNLEHAPVKAFMSSPVVNVSLTTPVSKLQRMMIKKDIGRLPVVDGEDQLVGIVTRTDLLRTTFGRQVPQEFRGLYGSSKIFGSPVYRQLDARLEGLSRTTRELLWQAGMVASRLEMDLYLVGGFVRDLLLDYPSLDLDLVVEGDSSNFARELAEELGGEILQETIFGTIKMKVREDFHLDLAISRVEYYEQPGSLPQVQSATLEEDLFRRDFTINALALNLNPEQWGTLIDYFNGYEDLERGLIRALHNFSFVDDPLRILRGLRFASRYGFQLEEHTSFLIDEALKHDVLEEVSPSRLADELREAFKEQKIISLLELLEEKGIRTRLFPGVSPESIQLLTRLGDSLSYYHQQEPEIHLRPWLIRLMLFLSSQEEEELEDLCSRIRFTGQEEKLLRRIPWLQQEALSALREAERGSEIYRLLSGLDPEELLFLHRLGGEGVRASIELYLSRLKELETEVSGQDLIEMGLKPGPLFSQLLDRVREARLDGRVHSREQELDLIEDYLSQWEGLED